MILERVILSLSDQQLISGLAVLVAGLSLHCSISVYHFSIVKDLGWLSATVHLLTILTLKPFFKSNKVLRNVRLWLVSVNAALLTFYLIITAHPRRRSSLAYNAQCLLDDLPYGSLKASDLRSIVYIFFYHVFLIPGLFSASKDLVEQRARDPNQGNWIKALTELPTVLGRYLSTRLIGWLCCNVMFGTGVVTLVIDLKKPTLDIKRVEKAMGFGQIVPIFLLCSTILVFVEALAGEQARRYFLK